jgi:18S rRNA (adenine1779-N6/adenine1780-N6)-dimethyltransferase
MLYRSIQTVYRIRRSIVTMPKATSQTFVAARPQPGSSRHNSSTAGSSKNGESSTGGGGGRNHIFNTDRFGQHILTNPLVAQG